MPRAEAHGLLGLSKLLPERTSNRVALEALSAVRGLAGLRLASLSSNGDKWNEVAGRCEAKGLPCRRMVSSDLVQNLFRSLRICWQAAELVRTCSELVSELVYEDEYRRHRRLWREAHEGVARVSRRLDTGTIFAAHLRGLIRRGIDGRMLRYRKDLFTYNNFPIASQ